MTRRHHILTLTVLISIVSLILPLTASAVEFDGFTYTDNGATATITGCVGGVSHCLGALTIPATTSIDGTDHPVTSIALDAFRDATGLTSITIPSSVTSIADQAFLGASNLTTVTFAGTSQLTSIGNNAFNSATSLMSITIPSSVTSIGAAAFTLATSLTSITIPSSVTSIGARTFMHARGLTAVTFAGTSQLTSIGDNAFYDARSLTSITIPSSVTSIGLSAFASAPSLTSVFFMGNAPTVGAEIYKDTDAALVSYYFSVTTGWPAVGSNNWPAGDILADRRTTALAVAPATPPAPTVTPGNGSAAVTVAAGSGHPAASYTVTANPGGRTCIVTGTAGSCTVTSLIGGTSYTFTVTATNPTGTSSASDASGAVTPVTVPDAPTGVAGVSGNTQVVVSWSAPVSNGGAPITAYTVEASSAGGTCGWLSGTALSCIVTGLTNGTSYTFTVIATNLVGTSTASDASSAVTPATVPDVPRSVAGAGGNGQVVVSWDAPVSNGGSAIIGYTVTASPGVGTCGWSSGTPSCTVTGLTNGTSYTFTVTATNSAGTSSPSSSSAAVTPAPVVPDAPTSVAGAGGNGQVVVSWSAPASTGGAAITAYTVTASPDGRTCEWSSGAALSCTITGLTNGTSYTFTVTATNAVGTSSASLASSAVTPVTVPDAPSSPPGTTLPITIDVTVITPIKIQWSKPTLTRPLLAAFAAAPQTTYTISATRTTKASKIIRGSCTVKSGKASCKIKLASKGKWTVAITPKKKGKTGKPATKIFKI